METHQTKLPEEITEEILVITAGEKKFPHLLESPKDCINSNTNGINEQFNDVLEEWRRKDGPLEDVNKQFNDVLEEWRRKDSPLEDVNKQFNYVLEEWRRKDSPLEDVNKQFNDVLKKWKRKDGPLEDVNKQFNDVLEEWRRKDGPLEDVNRQFKDLLIDMSRKQDERLTKEKSIINLKRNYSQEREIREIITFTAGEKEILVPDEAKESVNIDAKVIDSVSNAVNPATILQEKENMIEELKVKLEEFQADFKDLKEESQIYERILTEELDTMRSMLRELRTSNARLLLQAEYNEERIKIYKSQITALEEKDRNYNLIICRLEQTIMHLKEEVLVAQEKLYKTEKSLENSNRNKEETLDVTMTNEDLGVGNKGSMEVAGL
jgi:hypothetical protein